MKKTFCLFLMILFGLNLHAQHDKSCEEIAGEIVSLNELIANEENTVRRNIYKSNRFSLENEEYRMSCPNKILGEIDTLNVQSVSNESRRSRGASEQVFSTYSDYLSQMNLANCCKKTEKWDYTYYQYPYEKFSKMRFLKKRIKFNKINYPILKAAILYTLNEVRKENQLPAYYFNYALETSASEHALNMQVYNFFSHTSPFRGKETPGKRALAAGFPYTLINQTIEKQFAIEYDKMYPCEKCGHRFDNHLDYCNKCNTRRAFPLFTPDLNKDYFSHEYKGKPIKKHTYKGFAEALVSNLLMKNEDREVLLSPQFNHFGVGLRYYRDRQFFEMDMFYVVLVAGEN